jgi:hypothetical protein
LSEVVETNEASDLIARFKLSRLEFGTRYDYEIYLDGLRVPLAPNPSFQSQAMWRWRTEPPPCRIAIGSCAYINDADYDRPVKAGEQPYGGGYEIFQTIARQQPDAMLWLGDNIYYREADWLNEKAMRYRYAHGRALPEMRELLASTHHYAISTLGRTTPIARTALVKNLCAYSRTIGRMLSTARQSCQASSAALNGTILNSSCSTIAIIARPIAHRPVQRRRCSATCNCNG